MPSGLATWRAPYTHSGITRPAAGSAMPAFGSTTFCCPPRQQTSFSMRGWTRIIVAGKRHPTMRPHGLRYPPSRIAAGGAGSKCLFVDTIDPIDMAIDRFGNRNHPFIVFEDPANLSARGTIVRRCRPTAVFDQHEGELAGQPGGLQFLDYPHQGNAHRVHFGLAQAPEQLGPAKGEQPAVQLPDEFVQVRQRHHEGDRLAIHLSYLDEILEDDGP